MEGKALFEAIRDFGFPIFVSWYLLVRMEAKLDKLSANIEILAHAIDLSLKSPLMKKE